MVRIPGFHPGGPGSISALGTFLSSPYRKSFMTHRRQSTRIRRKQKQERETGGDRKIIKIGRAMLVV